MSNYPALVTTFDATNTGEFAGDDAMVALNALQDTSLPPQARAEHMKTIQDALDHGAKLQQKIEALETELYTDPVTGGNNRKAFMKQLEAIIEQISAGSQQEYVLVFLDLDGFKKVNDICGHDVGDETLYDADMRLNEAINQRGHTMDYVARLGGDEMVLLLRVDDGRALSNDALRQITRGVFAGMGPWTDVAGDNPQYHPIGASLGAFAISRDSIGGMSTSDAAAFALSNADAAMYVDKAGKPQRLAQERANALQTLADEESWSCALNVA